MFLNLDKFSNFSKFLALLATALFLTSCFRPGITVPKSSYNSDDLSKRWKQNIEENRAPTTQVPSYRKYRQQPPQNQAYQDYSSYPADNDADYVAPKYEYRLVPVEPKPTNPKRNKRDYPDYFMNPPYPQDNDSDEIPAYPTYDPDADNDSYYILNKDKKLPPPRKAANSKNPELYDYPIYFD